MSITINVKAADNINFAASFLKKQQILGGITLSDIDSSAVGGKVVLRISADPGFLVEYKKEIPVSGSSVSVPAPELLIDAEFFRTNLVEGQDGQIRIEVVHTDDHDKILGFLNCPVHIQAYQHWDAAHYPEVMAGFVQPNDPNVIRVIKAAAEYAEKDGNSMCGYYEKDVKKLVGYTYRALQDQHFHYNLPPASFEVYGQKIRPAGESSHPEVKQGTCLDLAVLTAACLESADLNAVIFVIRGHAFAGCFRKNQAFNCPLVKPGTVDNWEEIKKEIIAVECTYFTDGKNVPFESAVSLATKNMEETIYMIDVAGSRKNGITPAFTFTDSPICADDGASGEEQEREIFTRTEFSREKKSRWELFCEQAMDITAGSRLLNCRADKSGLELDIDACSFLEGDISEKKLTEIVLKKNGKTSILRKLYSQSCQSLRETGKKNTYLSLGELCWKNEAGKDLNAVLYLVPVEIYPNGRGDFQLRYDAEHVIFNPALRVMLSQTYHLDSSKLLDNPGAGCSEQLAFLKFLIGNQTGWSVKANASHLSQFAIPNESVWRGLHDGNVVNHEIVAGILNGSMDWENEVKPKEGAVASAMRFIYPFRTDSSQCDIIEAAFRRRAQVVCGPAGNGKTQTVVNIMAEAVRRGEKVLFVSEMAPAMEVAYDKLNELFDGLFSLRIIEGKDRVQDVIRQLKKTLDFLEKPGKKEDSEEMETARRKYRECLEYVENYYEVMGRKNACGKSLEDLINMSEKYADTALNLQLDEKLAKIPLSEAEDQVSVYSRVMEECDLAKGQYSEYVRYDNLEGSQEALTLELAEKALKNYAKTKEAEEELKQAMNMPETGLNDKEQLQEMLLIAKALKDCPVFGKTIEDVMQEDGTLDHSFQKKILRELKRLKGGRTGLMKMAQREKCVEILCDLYEEDAAREIVEDYEASPKDVIDELSSLEIVADSEGELHIKGNSGATREELKDYLDKAKYTVEEEPEEIRRLVSHTIGQIVAGRGNLILDCARQLYTSYRRYNEAQAAAAEKIIRNADAFAKQYPELPRTVLFEEWIENRGNDNNRSRALYDSVAAEMEKEGYGELVRQIEQARADLPLTRQDVLNGYYKAWARYHIDEISDELVSSGRFNYVIFQDKVRSLCEREAVVRAGLKDEIILAQQERMPNISEGVSNNAEFGVLQTLVRRKNTTIRAFFEKAPDMLRTICPCMIMDPYAVAEYIPSDFPKFDLVLIDEGSQMPACNALIPISHGERVMIFGDEQQLQPRTEFRRKTEDEFESTVGRESILTAAYITSMPRKMLRFHYRSEDESLVAFSNARYYNGDIITFPSCSTKISSGVSYEYVEGSTYDRDGNKANAGEAKRVIEKIREIYEALPEKTDRTLGVITLNVHQRDYIQSLLLKEVRADSALGMKVDELVTVVNLENCQGKEWDYVIIAPGFGKDKDGKVSTSFGALNQEYGANRLNVMLTRAKKQMFVISGLEPYMLTGARSEGVQAFREFLRFAKGDVVYDTRVCERSERTSGLTDRVAAALEASGYEVHTNIGTSDFKVDLGIVSKTDPGRYVLGILVDHYKDGCGTIHDREVTYPESLQAKGWKIYRLHELNWDNDSRRELRQIRREAAEK